MAVLVWQCSQFSRQKRTGRGWVENVSERSKTMLIKCRAGNMASEEL